MDLDCITYIINQIKQTISYEERSDLINAFVNRRLEESRFPKIPVEKRTSVYSHSILDQDALWTIPSYDKGEIWSWYGNIGRQDIYEVIARNEIVHGKDDVSTQILFKKILSVHLREIGGWAVYSIEGRHGYATCGTPQMRLRLL